MIAEHDPAILFRGAVDLCDHVPDGFGDEFDVGLQVDAHLAAAADVIWKGQATLKTLRPQRAAKRLQQMPRVTIRDRLHRNVWQVRRLFFSDAWRAGNCGHTRRQRVAGVNEAKQN